jgi:DNA-binding CsgD family transcriptional regulator/GAF domain-containing protein
VRAAAAAALSELGALLGHDLGPVGDHGSAVRALEQGIALGESQLQQTGGSSLTATLAIALSAAHRVRRRLTELHAERHSTAAARLTASYAQLDTFSDSVADLVTAVPEMVCRLGFDRAMISRIESGTWHPELMFIMGGDDSWAEQITTAGNTRPAILRPGMPEAELVDERKAILVTGVRHSLHPRSGQQAMINASGTRSYVAAPVISGDHVVGMLHADCYGARRDVDEFDRDVLAAFAAALRLALARCALHEQLTATRSRLTQLSVELRSASGTLDHMPVLRVVRPPHESHVQAMMVRVGNPDAAVDALPASLTTRELEVLRLMAAGCTNTAIAERLMIAEGTVKKHVMHVFRKLHATNRSEAVSRWFRSGGDAGMTQPRRRRRAQRAGTS